MLGGIYYVFVCSLEVIVSILKNDWKVTYGQPVTMAVAYSSSQGNLLGMVGLGLLHLDIDSQTKTLVPTAPARNRRL
jgi:hypothetical protein